MEENVDQEEEEEDDEEVKLDEENIEEYMYDKLFKYKGLLERFLKNIEMIV